MKINIQQLFLLIVFFGLCSGLHASEGPQVKTLKGLKPNRILFVGNSYLYYNDSLHNHVKRMFVEKFPDAKTFPQIIVIGTKVGGYDKFVTYLNETGYNGTGYTLS